MPLPQHLLDKPWLGASEFAAAVGINVRSVQRWCRAGRVPCRRRGPKLWFLDMRAIREQRESDLNAFVLEAQVDELRKVTNG
jgi:predicted site-specific integrase-resolvase